MRPIKPKFPPYEPHATDDERAETWSTYRRERIAYEQACDELADAQRDREATRREEDE